VSCEFLIIFLIFDIGWFCLSACSLIAMLLGTVTGLGISYIIAQRWLLMDKMMSVHICFACVFIEMPEHGSSS